MTKAFKVMPLTRWFIPKCDSRPEARTVIRQNDGRPLNDPPRQSANPQALQQRTCSANVLRQPFARLFSRKETGASNTAAALIALGFAATSLVTIGVTNADVTSNSAVDDGAADQGMDCT